MTLFLAFVILCFISAMYMYTVVAICQLEFCMNVSTDMDVEIVYSGEF